jgi:hypothetical protein
MNKQQKEQVKRRLQEVGLTKREIRDILRTQGKRRVY